MDKFEIKNKIEQECKDLPENFIVNVSINQHIYNEADLLLIECLIKKLQAPGLYVSLNKPYETILEELKQANLDANKIYFIDGVSKETGKFSNSDKCFCLEYPSSLTELSLLIKTLCDEGKIKFIVLDSLSTLLLYNGIKTVEKFTHSLITKARKLNASVVIMTPKEKSEEDVLAVITQFCDKQIDL